MVTKLTHLIPHHSKLFTNEFMVSMSSFNSSSMQHDVDFVIYKLLPRRVL